MDYTIKCSLSRLKNIISDEVKIMIEVLKSKIHRAAITNADINYEGSITISSNLVEMAKMLQYEKVLVVDINNGQRFETYIIKTNEENVICVNGAASRLVSIGDRVIIMTFQYVDSLHNDYKPIIIKVNEKNEVIVGAQ